MNIHKGGLPALAVLATVGLGTAATASTYTFDFTQNGNTGWQETFDVQSDEDSGVSVDVSGARYNDSNTIKTGNSWVATWDNAGLGVCGDVDWFFVSYCDDPDHRVDGSGDNDLAIFDLDQDYELVSIGFSFFSSAWEKEVVGRVCTQKWWGTKCENEYEWTEIFDEFDLFIDLGDGLQYSFTDLVEDTYLLGSSLISSSFGVGASGKYDAFKITSLTVATPIPLPAGGVLLLTALGGLGLAARRRRG